MDAIKTVAPSMVVTSVQSWATTVLLVTIAYVLYCRLERHKSSHQQTLLRTLFPWSSVIGADKTGDNGSNQTSTTVQRPPLSEAPSPLALPVIGHLYLLAQYPSNPWQGFNAIRRRYGNVVRLQLGKYSSVMVSTVEAIREVLLVKGEAFSDRPHFDRHALIFGSNRQNALALCDWTNTHKTRRSIAHAAVIPRFGTKCFQRLSTCINKAVSDLLREMEPTNVDARMVLEKDRLVRLCCSIFVEFLLEKSVDINSEEFTEICRQYDFIFYDINQMYLCDFLPFLKPITARSYLNQVQQSATDLRNFIEKQVSPRLEELAQCQKTNSDQSMNEMPIQASKVPEENSEDQSKCEERFVDRLLLQKQYQSNAKLVDFMLTHYLESGDQMSWEECLYEIGDLVGGNSAVANLMCRLLGHLALNPQVQDQLHEEASLVLASKPGSHQTLGRHSVPITLEDCPYMPLTNASIMETLRLSSSPIVPHLARWDTSIQGYFIPKNTMVLFNIYHLNLSSNYWDEPYKFKPSRFVTEDGNVVKPEYFFPFSHGRRSCLGYKMVNTIIFATVANLLLRYRLIPADETPNFDHNQTGNVGQKSEGKHRQLMKELLEPRGTIALPYDSEQCYAIKLVARD